MKRRITDEQAIEIYMKMKQKIAKVFLEDEYKVSKKTLYNIERKREAYEFLKTLIND